MEIDLASLGTNGILIALIWRFLAVSGFSIGDLFTKQGMKNGRMGDLEKKLDHIGDNHLHSLETKLDTLIEINKESLIHVKDIKRHVEKV